MDKIPYKVIIDIHDEKLHETLNNELFNKYTKNAIRSAYIIGVNFYYMEDKETKSIYQIWLLDPHINENLKNAYSKASSITITDKDFKEKKEINHKDFKEIKEINLEELIKNKEKDL